MKKFYKIIDIHIRDAFYPYRFTVVGLKGYLKEEPEKTIPDFVGCDFYFNKEIFIGKAKHKKITFFAIKIEEIK